MGGFGDAEVGVDVQGALPMLVGLIQLGGGEAGGGQPVAGSGLLVAVTCLTRKAERGGVAGAGLVWLAGAQQGFSSAVKRLGFPSAAAGCLEER